MELSRSNVFVDSGGDGLLHRTAWAGAGDGVLFFDANGDNRIGEKREYVFTEWDPTAASDLAALRSYFDRNGDGKLTAADPAFARFKVMVTNADGSQTARTLAQLGIREIALIGDATHITLPDGSVITGQSTFTRTNGTTGTVADVMLVSDAEGRRVVQTVTVDGAGTRTVVSQAYDADGSLAYTITSVTSPDGFSVSNAYDDNGDGIADRFQTVTTMVDGSGARAETLVNYQGNSLASAAVVNRTVTTTSADRLTLTIARDSTGGGWFDQVEVRVKNADGSSTITISDLARDGRVIASSTETVSAGGNMRVELIDINGDGLIDSKASDVFAQQGTERVNTVAVHNRDDSLRTLTEERVSADGKSKRVSDDLDGNGWFETQKQLSIATAANGTSTSTLSVRNADGTLRSRTEQAQSADTLTKTIRADVDGDGDFDITTVNATVIAANGSRTETTTIRNIDGSIREMARSTLGADKVTGQTWVDLNQDGTFQATDLVGEVTVATDTQLRTASAWERNADGSVNRTAVTVTSADGLTATTSTDADSDGDIDRVILDATERAGDGRSVRTVTDRNGDGSQRAQTVTLSSADGLTVTTLIDSQGTDALDGQVTDQLVRNPDGSLTRTVTALSGDGAVLLSRSVTADSADRLSSTVTTDLNGDGAVDLRLSSVENAAGAKTVTTEVFKPNGQLASRAVTALDATGLIGSSTVDANGDGTNETAISDVTVLNADGSRNRTIDTNNGDGSNRGLLRTKVSDDGFVIWSHLDLNGDDVGDRTTVSITTLNNDGSVRAQVGTLSTSFRLLRLEAATTSDDGLSVTRMVDADGDGHADWRGTTLRSLGNDGSVTTEQAVFDVRDVPGAAGNYGSALRARSLETVSDDARRYSLSEDVNGDGAFDRITARNVADTGVTTATVSERNADGSLQSRTETVTSANRLSVTRNIDADGDGVSETQIRDVSLLNANGSVTRTVSHHAQDGSRYRQETTVTGDDGTSVTQSLDLDGDGRADRTSQTTSSLAANGVMTVTAATYAASGERIFEDIVVTSADKRNVTRSVDENGDRIADRTIATVTGNDGVTTATTNYFGRDGALHSRITVATSQDGLSRTETRDWGVNGADYVIRSNTSLGQDGSQTTNITYHGGNGALWATDWNWKSDDGLIVRRNIADPGANRPEVRHTWTTAYESNGDVVTVHESRNDRNALLSSSQLRESGNGLTSHYALNVNASGGNERTVDRITLADGESTTVTRSFKMSGGLAGSETIKTSADGRTIDRDYDDNGDGALDRGWDSVTDLSRNTINTFTEHGANGVVAARITVTAAANKSRETSLFDLDGNGTAEITRSTARSFAADGSVTDRYQEVSGGRLSYVSSATAAADGQSEKITVDIDGDGDVDHTTWNAETVHLSGSTTRISYATYADGWTKSYVSSARTADGRDWWENNDRNGDGVIDVREHGTRDSLGNVSTSRTVFKWDGQVMSQTNRFDSADGFFSRITRSGEYGTKPQTETITRSILGNGSYFWSNGQSPSHLGNGGNFWSNGQSPSHNGNGNIIGLSNGQSPSQPENSSHFQSNGQIHSYHLTAQTSEHYLDSIGSDTWTFRSSYMITESYVVSIYVPRHNRDGGSYYRYETRYRDVTRTDTVSVVLDQEAKANIFDEAERIYDAILDRGITWSEYEHLIFHISDGTLNDVGLAAALMDTEFSTRYGQLGNAEFVGRLYQNALGRAPSLDELTKALDFLSSGGSNGRAAFAVEIANSSEHFVVGNSRLSTNNADLELSPPQREALLDRAAVHAIIERLFDTIYDRAPTDYELSHIAWHMMNRGMSVKEVAAMLRPLSGDLLNVPSGGLAGLSGLALVERAFMNALGRLPTAAEAATWTGHLAANRLSPDEFLAALSESTEHLSAGIVYRGGAVSAITLTGDNASQTLTASATRTILLGLGGNDTLIGSWGGDELRGGAGDDVLRGGGGNDQYYWSPGDGNDRIEDGSTTGVECDTLWLDVVASAASLVRETIRIPRKGKDRFVPSNDLKIVIGNEAITVVNYYQSAGLERIVFVDGTIFHLTDPWQVYGKPGADTLNGDEGRNSLHGLGGNDTIDGRGGFDWLFGNDGDDTLLGGAGDDLLTGGAGSDYIAGGAGSDTYMWARGDGSDTIDENADTASWFDSLILKDIRSSDVTVQRSGQDALLVIAPSQPGGTDGGTIRILNIGSQPSDRVGSHGMDRIFLSDGTWTRGDLQTMLLQSQSTAGDDTIAGFASGDTLSGLGGNDRFVFAGRFGSDRITDFSSGAGPGDVLQLSLGAAYDTVSEVMAAARQVNSDTVFNFGDLGSITLQNTAMSSLTADDFLFA